MKARMSFLLLLFLCLGLPSLFAQKKASFEFRAGAAFPLEQLGETDLKTGFGFEGIFDYRFLPHLSAYAGWGWNQFTTEEANSDMDVEETGYLFGLQFNHPIGNGPLSYYIRVGGLYNHLELENKAGDIVNDSGHGLGYRIGIGVDLALTENIHLRPGVKYQSLSRDVTIETSPVAMDHNYFAASLGIGFDF